MHQLVFIGASTGGPGQITKIVQNLSKSTTASFIIAQHMQSEILKSFVSQLSDKTELPVYLAQNNTKIQPSSIYICKENLEVFFDKTPFFLSAQKSRYTPSIDILFQSAVKLLPQFGIIAIILTGIGDDGAQGLHELYKKGAICIAESAESAKVYGMPKAAYEYTPSIEVMHIDNITAYLKNV